MTTFNSNMSSNIGSRCTVGMSRIKSPTEYSDMFIGADKSVISSMIQPEPGLQYTSGQENGAAASSIVSPNRMENLKKFFKQNPAIQSVPDINYKIIDNIEDAQQACILLSGYHSVSVLWEGINVNRHGTLAWIICGYLGSAILFNVSKCGPALFTRGGLQTLLEARHPIKVIHDCACISDILYHQYNVTLQLESVFDTCAADLVIQSKVSPDAVTSKTLVECLIEYHDIPTSVYRTRESVIRREGTAWLLPEIPEELLLATARIARYAVLLHTLMLNRLSEPLPNITQLYLNQRYSFDTPSPFSKKKQISKELANILLTSKYKQCVVKTDWNIPDSVINPQYEEQRGEMQFYNKPFKFDIKKATPGSLKIFSIDPNTQPDEDDDDWEKHVQRVPTNFDTIFNDPDDMNQYEYEPRPAEPPFSKPTSQPKRPSSPTTIFKVPEMFSDTSISSANSSFLNHSHSSFQDVSSHDTSDQKFTTRDETSAKDRQKRNDEDGASSCSYTSDSTSDDGVQITMGSTSPPPTIKAQFDPSLLGSKIIWPGDDEQHSDNYQGTTMCNELRDLVEEIRLKKQNQPRSVKSNAYVSTEEMRRHLKDERNRPQVLYPESEDSYHSQDAHRSGNMDRSTYSTNTSDVQIVRILEKPVQAGSDSSSSSEDVIIQPRVIPGSVSDLRVTVNDRCSSAESRNEEQLNFVLDSSDSSNDFSDHKSKNKLTLENSRYLSLENRNKDMAFVLDSFGNSDDSSDHEFDKLSSKKSGSDVNTGTKIRIPSSEKGIIEQPAILLDSTASSGGSNNRRSKLPWVPSEKYKTPCVPMVNHSSTASVLPKFSEMQITSQNCITPALSNSQISKVSETKKSCAIVSNQKTTRRPPLKLKPKTCRGLGRGRGAARVTRDTGPPPLVSKTPSPVQTTSLSSTRSSFSPAPSTISSLGRGSASVISDRTKATTFGDMGSLSTRTPVSICASRPDTPDSAAEAGLYHDLYEGNVVVITDNFTRRRGSSSEDHHSATDQVKIVQSPAFLTKPNVSLCFAYDSDDPDNF